MSAHAVSRQADLRSVQLVVHLPEEKPRQLLGHVAVHVVSVVVRCFGRVDVEPRTTAKVVVIVFALEAPAP